MGELGIPVDVEPRTTVGVRRGRGSRRPRLVARVLTSSRARQAVLYGAAGVSYVVAGVFVTELALSWVVGFAWLLAWVWGVPALGRRLRSSIRRESGR
jgi:hypothetical protein